MCLRWPNMIGELRDALQEQLQQPGMGCSELSRMDAVPDFELKEPAGREGRTPERDGRSAVFTQEVRESDRTIEIDQRSARSASSSSSNSFVGAIGWRGGGSPETSPAGVIHPFRTASARAGLVRKGLGASRGGFSSAMTRSCSEMRTVSPFSARWTSSLDSFLQDLQGDCTHAGKVARRPRAVKRRQRRPRGAANAGSALPWRAGAGHRGCRASPAWRPPVWWV